MKKFIHHIIPPENWRLPVIIVLGIFFGLFFFTFYISKAPSYLSDSPETCVNCHIMAPQYATWSHSAHGRVTNCNDCHVPHNNAANKYFFKAKDGLRHATVFTMRGEPQVIFAKKASQEVIQRNCLRCHSYLLTDSKLAVRTKQYQMFRQDRKCWDCHRGTPHGTVNGLSSVPFAQVPLLKSPVPDWLKNLMKKQSK